MEGKICQSCGMPLTKPEACGTEQDGSPSGEYCTYCYQNGSYTRDCTMEEMVELNLQYLDEFNKDSPKQFSAEEARKEMLGFFPQLKRWRQ